MSDQTPETKPERKSASKAEKIIIWVFVGVVLFMIGLTLLLLTDYRWK